MSFEHPSKLSFSIEESVWLNKGEEVEEVLGMSLEPEIVIEERDAHVYIRGGLRLLGEYRSSSNEKIDMSGETLEQQVSFRSVKDVSVSSNGIGEIKHYFPIDVTIPSNRIQNLDDVFVQVESFDYDLPEPSCIQLTADIAISGMTYKKEEQIERAEEKIEKAESAPVTAFSFEAKKEQSIQKDKEARKQQEQIARQEEASLEEQEVHVDDQQGVIENVEREKEQVEGEPVVAEESQEDGQEELEQIEEPNHQEIERETQPEMNVHISPLKELANAEPTESADLSDEQTVNNQHAEQEVKEEKPREENALYLTKMLSKGEERFSKWKMCIIQENESLETIAQRYDISMSQLIRMNRLQGEQVEEGQILYIPVSVES